MIIPVQVQLRGEKEPHQHYALVFPDVSCPGDLIPYRNALTMAAKTIVSTEDIGDCCNEEAFWLIQLSEFISTSLDAELKKKGGSNG